jgi:hypothetical protein
VREETGVALGDAVLLGYIVTEHAVNASYRGATPFSRRRRCSARL